jgi:hypothetical protein
MKKTIKLRDLTEKQYAEWHHNHCELTNSYNCANCIFRFVSCDYDYDNSWVYYPNTNKECWVNNKDLYSDKFLDQTIEIEVPDLLTEEEKALLKQLVKSSAFEVKAIEFVISSDFVYVEFINNRGSEQNDCFHFQKSLFKGIEQTKQYTFEDLGLEDK